MTGTLARAAWLAAVYLLVLSSVAPGDLLIAGALGLAVAFALRGTGRGPERPMPRLRAALGMLLQTGSEIVRGAWVTARFCLGARLRPGLVEIPRGDRSPAGVALWGLLTGEAPDEYPVDADEERGVLLVHVLESGEPDAIRERHERTRRRWQRRVVP